MVEKMLLFGPRSIWSLFMILAVVAVVVLLVFRLSKSKVWLKKEKLIKRLTVIFVIIALITGFFSFGYPALKDAQSGRSWEDLEDWEKDNAKWAYEAQQAIDEYKD